MHRLKILLAVSLVLNLVLVGGGLCYVSKAGARAVAEAAGIIEPRRPAFDTYAEERFGDLPAADVVLIGDSQIERGPWSELLRRPVASRGLSGQTIAEVESWLDRDAVGDPLHLVVWVGSNDVLLGHSPQQIEADMRELLDTASRVAPDAEVIVLTIPALSYGDPAAGNAAIARAAFPAVTVLDVDPALGHDGVHLTGEGYVEVADRLLPLLG